MLNCAYSLKEVDERLVEKGEKKGVITNSKMTVIFVFISFFLVDGAAHYLRHIVPFRPISQLEKYKKGPHISNIWLARGKISATRRLLSSPKYLMF